MGGLKAVTLGPASLPHTSLPPFNTALPPTPPPRPQPVLAPYAPLEPLQQKRLSARRHKTTYCYDFPAVFENALREIWAARAAAGEPGAVPPPGAWPAEVLGSGFGFGFVMRLRGSRRQKLQKQMTTDTAKGFAAQSCPCMHGTCRHACGMQLAEVQELVPADRAALQFTTFCTK